MIRELEEHDYKDYLLLLLQLNGIYKETTRFVFWEKYKHIKSCGGTIYVYTIDDKIVGAIKILEEKKFYDSVIHIEDVVVDRAFRGKGIGKKLINHAINIIPENSYKIILQCSANLEKWYLSLGFKNEGYNMVIRTNRSRI
jgi:glucosamine-phosphate N-acetyltransferase